MTVNSMVKAVKLRVFIVPHWHFDALWQLSFEEYFNITVRNLIDLLEFLDLEPEYRFNLDQSIYVEEFMKRFPELTGKLKEAIKRGLIEPVCSGFTQPDSNIPNGEFLVRNITIYQKFMEETFGVRARCGWFIDVYGQSAQLPQIFKKSGVEYFVFWRGVPDGLPSEFLWEGIDGTRILTHRMPLGYGAGYIPTGEWRYYFFICTITDESAIEFLNNLINRLRKWASTNNILIPNGGDFTPPQRFLPSVVKKWRKRRRDLEIYIATASQFFKAVEESRTKLPVIRGEFNPIFRGTYSARIEIKKANREVENLYLNAEKFASIASLFNFTYPRKALEKALKLILTNQFHDAINGEVIDEVYEHIMNNYRTARELCSEVLEEALQEITDKIDTRGNGIPIVVFNPLSWIRTDIVSVEVAFGESKVKGIKLKDWKGSEVPYQFERLNKNPDGTLGYAKIVFTAENIPSLGYKVYYIVPNERMDVAEFKSSIKVSEERGQYTLENQYYLVSVDPLSKNIVRIYDKEEKKEVIDNSRYLGNSIFSEPDYGSVCNVNGEIDAHQTITPIGDLPNPDIANNTMKNVSHGRVIERGPVKATIYSYGVLENTKYKQYIMIYDKIKRIDFVTELDFGDEHRRIRVVFPINLRNGEIWHEIPYGAIRRGEGEYPAMNWIDISSDDYGVSLINHGIPGNSIVKGVMMLTLLRSIDAMYLATPFRELRLEKMSRMYLERTGKYFTYYALGPKALERGHHIFKYSLYPHRGNWREAKSYKVALEFNNPLIPVKTTKHEGILPKEYSFISMKPENLVLTAVKRSEEGITIRFYEAEGRSARGKIAFFKEVESAWEADLLERKIERLEVKNKEVPVEVKPFEIVTVILKPTE